MHWFCIICTNLRVKFRNIFIVATCMPFSDIQHLGMRYHCTSLKYHGTLRETTKCILFFQTRTQVTRERASVAAICPWTVRTAASTSARMMAAARTVVIRVPRIPIMAHHRTTPRRCRRVCTRPSTIPSTNCSWCKVVTSAAITRNPSFPLSSSLYLPPSVTVSLEFVAYFLSPSSSFASFYPFYEATCFVNEEADVALLFNFPCWNDCD